MSKDIFLSVGGTANEKQEKLVQALESRLKAEGLIPNTVGRNTFSSESPLQAVEELMERCVGTVVLALERSYFSNGLEKRGGIKEKSLSDISLPTTWNHIEAAMSYSRRIPLLVIVQEGLKDEGLLEHGYGWYVQRIPLDEAYLNSPEFNGVLASWKTKIEESISDKRPPVQNDVIDPSKLTVGEILGRLKPAHLWTVIVTSCAVIAGAFSLGAQLVP